MELTIEQAREYLASVGIAIPDFMLQLLVDKANSIDACLIANGYSNADALLIKLYALGLMAAVQGDAYITSQRAPNGAARSFRYNTLTEKYDATLSLLNSLDKYGCASSLIPEKPCKFSAALFVGRGGCYE